MMARNKPDRRYMFAAAGCGLMLMLSAGASLVGAAVMWQYIQPTPATTPVAGSAPSDPARPGVKMGLQAVKPNVVDKWWVGNTKLPEPAITADACDDMNAGGGTDGCITGEITCDQVLIGHTLGGVNCRFVTSVPTRRYPNTDTSEPSTVAPGPPGPDLAARGK
jgi:hypothetical protein